MARIRHPVERRFVRMLLEVRDEITVCELADSRRQGVARRLKYQRKGENHDLR